MKTLTSLLASLLFLVSAVTPAQAQSPTTNLVVSNGYSHFVYVWITLGASGGSCANNVNQLTVTDTGAGHSTYTITPNSANALQGRFTLHTGHSATITSSAGSCLNGTITFNAIPVCPCGSVQITGVTLEPCPAFDSTLPANLPNGVNQFEFNLNNGTQSGNQSIDITCNNGCNSIMKMSTVGASDWNWPGPAATMNSSLCLYSPQIGGHLGHIHLHPYDNNCNIIGVFPYGLVAGTGANCNVADNVCTGVDTGIPDFICPLSGQKSICQLNSTKHGGTVTITYKGPAPNCLQ